MKKYLAGIILSLLLASCAPTTENKEGTALVLQTDFGLKDGAVSAMKGVAHTVDSRLPIFDLTHEIPAYNIWEAAYRLYQTVPYWPAGTVIVSVVDPGVGSDRKSVVALLKTGQYIVTPDNGTLTLLAESPGISQIREIDEKVNRRKGSDSSYTFHGRDVYVYVAARLASHTITYAEVGPGLQPTPVTIPYAKASLNGEVLSGNIPVLDIQYGNIWTNIPAELVRKAGITTGDSLLVEIRHKDSVVYNGLVPMVHTFHDVPEGKPHGYLNSLMNFSLAINMGSFADTYHVKSGAEWAITIRKSNSTATK